MYPEDLVELYSRSVNSDDRLPAMLTTDADGAPFAVELRFRGNTTRKEPKKGFNIRFDDGNQDFLWGGDRINARAMWRDPSFLREYMSMWLFREYDLPAPRTFYFELFINDVFEGFYQHVERIDRRFSRARGLNRDATLVRDQFRNSNNDCGVGATLPTAFGDNNWSDLTREEALECVKAKFNDRRADWDEVLDFILWVDGSVPGETFARELEERVDLEAMIKFIGVHTLIGDVDAFWGSDYWWFKDHEDANGKWFFIPWDKNLTFGSHTRANNPDGLGAFGQFIFPVEDRLARGVGNNRLFSYFLQTPSLRGQLEDWLEEQIDSDIWLDRFDKELEAALLQTTKYGRPYGIYDQEFAVNIENHFDLYGEYAEHVQQVTEFRDLRRNFLRRFLAGSSGPGHVVDLTLEDVHPAGEILWLVDNYGYTLGRFIPDEDLEIGTQINLKAIAGSDNRPINRDWEISSDRRLQGLLSVYYRNDAAKSNWYTLDDNASIHLQPYMTLITETEGMILENVSVLPIINRFDARIDFNVGGSGSAVLKSQMED